MPRWNFPPIPATGQLGGIGRIKRDESRKMIEFEVMFDALRAPAAQGRGTREPDPPTVAQVAAGSGRHSLIF
jgi:hypothetical protein